MKTLAGLNKSFDYLRRAFGRETRSVFLHVRTVRRTWGGTSTKVRENLRLPRLLASISFTSPQPELLHLRRSAWRTIRPRNRPPAVDLCPLCWHL